MLLVGNGHKKRWRVRAIKQWFLNFLIKMAYQQGCRLPFDFDNSGSVLGMLTYEFFHEDLGKFGGYGSTVRNITNHYNARDNKCGVKVVLSNPYPVVNEVAIRRVNNADVLFRSSANASYVKNFYHYTRLIRKAQINLFLSIDYYEPYEYSLSAAPAVPLMIWIRDPKGAEEWRRLASSPLEIQTHGKETLRELVESGRDEGNSLHRVMALARKYPRKIIFVTNGQFLVERARDAYGLPDLEAHTLMNPMPIPELSEITFSERPNFLAIGRLVPQKRFWMIGELARRHPEADFIVAGTTEYPKLMNPLIEKYQGIKNLKFIGVVDGADKERLFRECWGFLNTSVHEGLPVTFQEAFSYGKTVISSVNPEGLVEKYGYYTGDIVGEGLDDAALQKFSVLIHRVLTQQKERLDKGVVARKYIQQVHSFETFEKRLMEILEIEGVVSSKG